jgi:hypothetical protein
MIATTTATLAVLLTFVDGRAVPVPYLYRVDVAVPVPFFNSQPVTVAAAGTYGRDAVLVPA